MSYLEENDTWQNPLLIEVDLIKMQTAISLYTSHSFVFEFLRTQSGF